MVRLVAIAVAVMVLLYTPPAAAPVAAMQWGGRECPANATDLRGGRGTTCTCSARATQSGSVWGTDVYTDDSRICRAALHAGAIDRRGGSVSIEMLPGRDRYFGTSRNGVSSSNYGRWNGSYRFANGGGVRPPEWGGEEACPGNAASLRGANQALRCSCSARETQSGNVWGTDVYTDDSDICRAALHAGVISRRGGTVTLWSRPGQSGYRGSRRNGVATRDYGSWSGSFAFGRDDGARPPWPGNPVPLPGPEGGSTENCPGYGFNLTRPTTCRCTRTGVSAGAIYGTGVYNNRSAICRAALHDGVVGRDGGTITVYPQGGRRSYTASSRNGVTSQAAGPAPSSFSFRR